MQKKSIIAIVSYLVFITINVTFTQVESLPDFPSAREVKPKVSVLMSKDGLFHYYNYVVQNEINAVQRIWQFIVQIKTDSVFLNNPMDWESSFIIRPSIKAICWASLDSSQDIFAGFYKAGYSIKSKALPNIVKSFFAGFLEGLPIGDYEFKEGTNDIFYNSFKILTIGPTDPPFPFNSISFLDTLKSYTNQSRTLGWIANQTVANKYLAYFDTAKVRIQRGENKPARNTLLSILQNANQDSSGLLTSEAYALIRFNTEYLIENLPGVVTLPSSVNTGWNMISVPVDVSNYKKDFLYPQSTSNAFMYDAGYIGKDTLENGIGYWLKFGANDTIKYKGFIIEKDTIDVNIGWNMIGSISSPLDTSKIRSIPSGIILSKFFGYNNGYFITNKIDSGKGYWVKVNNAGKIILDKYSQSGGGQSQEPLLPPPPGAPDVPNLYSPSNGATRISKTPTLIWFASNNAQTYRLQVSTNSTFTNIIFNDSTLTSTSKQITGLTNSTTYYWRVNAKNAVWTSDWSSVWRFTTVGAPPPPDPCQPIDAFSVMDQFTVSDINGNKQQLFAHNGGRRLALGLRDYDMPPEPIEGVFHAKFKSGRFVESIPPRQTDGGQAGKGISKIPIKIKDANFPITISWDIRPESNTKYWVYRTKNQKIELSGKGSTTINSIDGNLLLIEAQAISPGPCEVY